jgi:para-aminobenzoate synthetase component 1
VQITSPPTPLWDFPHYAAAFSQVQAHLQAGDCYQVNLAQCFTAQLQGGAWPLVSALRALSPAPFAAYLNLPAGEILSASPERFLQVQGQTVRTEPIKGTQPRGATPAEDQRRADDLCHSEKDRAENVMIVDLLRNDLAKVCMPGSVVVEALCELQRFAQVQHLVSRVRGQLRIGLDALDALRAALPGGSVTGAPKRRALEIIDALEPARRGVYCGSIAYLSFAGQLDSNIAIRTLTCRQGELRFWAGGGIVADSTAEAEYQESYAKARALLELLA